VTTISGYKSDDDAVFGVIVKAADINCEAVLLEALEGCSKGWATQGLGGKAGSRTWVA
jgi:hypothetical protein